MSDPKIISLNDTDGALAWIAPELGGWLLRYSRNLEKHGQVDALYYSKEIVDRYPKQMYAGMPILFPLVGNNRAEGKEHHYTWNGKLFEMPQHGFGRRSEWKVIDQQSQSLVIELSENSGTLAHYPFSFLHQIVYELKKGQLHWKQTIQNRSGEPMPFNSGFHPFFSTPVVKNSRREDCFIELPDAKKVIPQGKWGNFSTKPFPSQNWSVEQDVSGSLFFSDLKSPTTVS